MYNNMLSKVQISRGKYSPSVSVRLVSFSLSLSHCLSVRLEIMTKEGQVVWMLRASVCLSFFVRLANGLWMLCPSLFCVRLSLSPSLSPTQLKRGEVL
jgi:hypothetical protein